MSVRTPTDTVGNAESEDTSSDSVDEAEEAASGGPELGQSLTAAVRRAKRATRRVKRRAKRALSRGKWYHHRRAVAVLAVLLVIVPAVIAFFVASARSEVYVADGEVLFSRQEEAFIDEKTTETLALIGRSDRVLAPVADRAGVPLQELKQSVATAVVETTTAVAVTVRRDDPDEAAALAESITEQWVESARQPTTPVMTGIAALIEGRTARLGELEAELTVSDLSTEERAALQEERSSVLTQLPELEEQLRELEGEDLFLGHEAEILAPAQAEENPVEPKPLQAAIAGGVVGMLLAGALVALAWQLSLRE